MPLAVGMYLPFGLGTPILLGGIMAHLLTRGSASEAEADRRVHEGVFFGVVIAGESLTAVLLAVLAVYGVETGGLFREETLATWELPATALASAATLLLFCARRGGARGWRHELPPPRGPPSALSSRPSSSRAAPPRRRPSSPPRSSPSASATERRGRAGRRPRLGSPRCYNPGSRGSAPPRRAAEGLRFTDAHRHQGLHADALRPADGALLLAEPREEDVLNGTSKALLEDDRGTLASLFRSEGYRTFGVGKWHLGLGSASPPTTPSLVPGPLSAGFDHYFGIRLAGHAALRVDRGRRRRGRAHGVRGLEAPPAGRRRLLPGGGRPGFGWTGAAAALGACLRVGRRAPGRRAFFLHVPLTAPHTPWVPVDRSSAPPRSAGTTSSRRWMPSWALATALEEAGLAEDTLVVFTSDNGSHWPDADEERWSHFANGPWRGQRRTSTRGAPGAVPRALARTGAGRRGVHRPAQPDRPVRHLRRHARPRAAGRGGRRLLLAARGLPRRRGQPARRSVVQHSMDGMFALRRGR